MGGSGTWGCLVGRRGVVRKEAGEVGQASARRPRTWVPAGGLGDRVRSHRPGMWSVAVVLACGHCGLWFLAASRLCSPCL